MYVCVRVHACMRVCACLYCIYVLHTIQTYIQPIIIMQTLTLSKNMSIPLGHVCCKAPLSVSTFL